MRTFINLFFTLILFAHSAWAQTSPGRRVDGTVFTGQAFVETNYVLAPQPYKEFDLNSTNTATSSATLTRDTTAGNLFQGLPSYICNTSANGGYCEFKLSTILKPHDAGNCAAYAYIKGDATLYGLQITDGTSAVVSLTVGQNLSDFRLIELPGVCGSTRTVRVTQTVAGTSPDVVVGWVGYSGYKPGAGVPPNTFTAKVSATGVVTDEAPSEWITGSAAITDSSNFTITPSVFTQNPNCSATYSGGDVGGAVTVGVGTMTAAAIGVRTGITTTSANFTKTALAFNIRCTKTGSDYIQPAITPNQWNYGPRLYTPTFGSGFGTPTNVECFHSRDGAFLTVDCKFTTGTVSANPGTVSLPPGLSSLTTSVGTKAYGTYFRGTASTEHGGAVLVGSASTAFTFSAAGVFSSTNTVALNAANGDAITSSSQVIHFTVRLPVAENGVPWTENQSAPQLVGSVTSNSSNALRIVSFTFNKSGGVCNSSPCDVTSATDPITVTRSATGTYPTNVKNYFNGTSQCFANNSGAVNNKCLINGAGTIYCTVTSTGGTIDEAADVFCIGPR